VGLLGVAVVERADLVLHVAQVDDDELAIQLRWLRQFALGCDQMGLDHRGHGPGAAIDLAGAPDPQARGCSGIGRGVGRPLGVEGEDVGAVVLAQPAAAAAVEERMPLVPGAAFGAVLQPAHQRKGQALVAAGRPQLQRLWSSNSSALVPMRLSASPSRTRVLRQKPQTALADAADANSTGAPQLGHAAR